MRSKTITIPGKPQGKERPRYTWRGYVYTPDKTREYENLVQTCWMQQSDGWKARDVGVSVIVTAYYPIPKSASKERKSGMLSGRIPPTVKPDADNVLKIVLDALNGHAWLDDKQVVCASVQKLYAEDPRVEVVLYDC